MDRVEREFRKSKFETNRKQRELLSMFKPLLYVLVFTATKDSTNEHFDYNYIPIPQDSEQLEPASSTEATTSTPSFKEEQLKSKELHWMIFTRPQITFLLYFSL